MRLRDDMGAVRIKIRLTNLVDEVLIGQTILEKLDLFVDCNRQRLIPNPAHPDQPVNKVK